MLQITVIAVGSLKEDYLKKACLTYQKRLTSFCRLQVKEIPSFQDGEKAVEQEGKLLLRALEKDSFVIALSPEGEKASSEQFSHLLTHRIPMLGKSRVCFLIGGSSGLSDTVKQRADLLLSFSDMTFPHALFRVLLFEQIYRAMSIEKGMKYHK